MKVTAIARAQATYALPPNIFSTIPVFDLVDALKAKYNFRHSPTGPELLNAVANQPATFLWGKREIEGRTVTVESLQVQNFAGFATTVTVVTRTSTDDCEAVLEDLAEWVRTNFSVSTKPSYPTNFVSQLECVLDGSLAKRLDFFNPIGDRITAYAKSYGFTACPPYEATAAYLYFDNSKLTNPPTLTLAFSIDRRAGVPFEENKYFAQAPLKTRDHIALLRELEKLLD
jgi:hypothetical protein